MIVAVTSRGITLEGLKDMTIGQAVDYVISWNDINGAEDKEEKPKKRKASQHDWDSLLG